jgi:hypothetical protein
LPGCLPCYPLDARRYGSEPRIRLPVQHLCGDLVGFGFQRVITRANRQLALQPFFSTIFALAARTWRSTAGTLAL